MNFERYHTHYKKLPVSNLQREVRSQASPGFISFTCFAHCHTYIWITAPCDVTKDTVPSPWIAAALSTRCCYDLHIFLVSATFHQVQGPTRIQCQQESKKKQEAVNRGLNVLFPGIKSRSWSSTEPCLLYMQVALCLFCRPFLRRHPWATAVHGPSLSLRMA